MKAVCFFIQAVKLTSNINFFLVFFFLLLLFYFSLFFVCWHTSQQSHPAFTKVLSQPIKADNEVKLDSVVSQCVSLTQARTLTQC